jgi:hypothetical protein
MGLMAMNKLTPEEVWTWIDQGTAEAKLKRMTEDPDSRPEELAMVRDLLALDRHLASSLLEEPSAGFDKAVLSVNPDWMPKLKPLLGLLTCGLSGGLLLSLVGSTAGSGSSPDSWSLLNRLPERFLEPGLGWQHLSSQPIPGLSDSWMLAAALTLPALLFFWALDRGLRSLVQRG